VKWQKGFGEFTAEDVLYSFKRILDPATASPYRSELAGIVKMEAPDPYTVVIQLNAPDGNFLHTVANYHQGQIVNKKAIEAAGRQVRWQPVGTGPYYLDSIDVNSRIVLKRHKDYFRGPAPIETIIFQIIKDEATATIALRNGEIDLKMRSNREENLADAEKEGFVMNKVDNYAVGLKVFNMDEQGPVRRPRAPGHRARRRLRRDHQGDVAHAAGAGALDAHAVDGRLYARRPRTLRPAKRQEAAGRGRLSEGLVVQAPGTSAQGVTEFQQFEIDYLSQVGIKMEMELVDTPTFNQRRNAGEFEMATRLLPAVNPDMILFSYLHPDNIPPKGLNGARYDNPELTELLEAARAEPEPPSACAVRAGAADRDDRPAIPAEYANNVSGRARRTSPACASTTSRRSTSSKSTSNSWGVGHADYSLNRLLQLVVTTLGVVTLVFFTLRLIPGDAASAMAGDTLSGEALERLREQMGLNKPILIQYLDYLAVWSCSTSATRSPPGCRLPT
jgi:peptide/nickel transport system substrate-binding protein